MQTVALRSVLGQKRKCWDFTDAVSLSHKDLDEQKKKTTPTVIKVQRKKKKGGKKALFGFILLIQLKNQRWEELHNVEQDTRLLKCNLHSEKAGA